MSAKYFTIGAAAAASDFRKANQRAISQSESDRSLTSVRLVVRLRGERDLHPDVVGEGHCVVFLPGRGGSDEQHLIGDHMAIDHLHVNLLGPRWGLQFTSLFRYRNAPQLF